MSTTTTKHYFYTDGATTSNGKKNAKGGWAWVRATYEQNVTNLCNSAAGHEDNTTNNRCELLAIINACKFAEENRYIPAVIYSDSAYVINCYKEKWYENWERNGWLNYRREDVANKDLWVQLIPYFKNLNFEFLKVKGHNGIMENELVDQMAREATNW